MTDVAGPARAAESIPAVNCSEAQAAETHAGNRKTIGRYCPSGAILRIPRRDFQIATPCRPHPISWINQLTIWVQSWLAASARKYLLRRDPRRADSGLGDLAEG